MGDITSGCTVKLQTALAGCNMIVIQTEATADDGDTIEINDLLVGGAAVKEVISANGVTDPTGTPVSEAPGYTDTNDTITIGGSTDNKRRDLTIYYK